MPFKNPHPLYHVWHSMHRRCCDTNLKQWKDYGGRGITVTERWYSFDEWLRDMGPRPLGYTLDRIDNDKGYYPANCKWSSRKDQQRNRRVAVYVTIEGSRHRVVELAEKSGVRHDIIVARAKRGMTLADVTRRERFYGSGPIPGSRPRKTHCPYGHEYTPENVIIINKAKGTRACRTCHNDRVSSLYYRRQAAKLEHD